MATELTPRDLIPNSECDTCKGSSRPSGAGEPHVRMDWDAARIEWFAHTDCADCATTYPHCGEFFDAAVDQALMYSVSVRLWENDGKLSTMHPECAANWLLETWSGVRHVDVLSDSREEINAMVAAFGMAVAA